MSQAVEALFPEMHQSVLPFLEQDYTASRLKGAFNTLNLYADSAQKKESNSQGKLLQRQKQHMQ